MNLWLVEVEVRGELVRLSLDDVEVLTEDGEVLLYHQGLLDEPQASAGEDSLSLSVRLPDLDGELLAGATVRVLHLAAGDVYERALLILEGEVVDTSWELPDTGVEIEVARAEDSQGLPFLDPANLVQDGVTWPVSGSAVSVDSQQGVTYPLILGYPGYVEEDAGTARPVVPVPVAEYIGTSLADSHLVIADRPLAPGTSGDTVRLLNTGLDGNVAGDEDWSTMIDGRGRVVSAAVFSVSTDPGGANVDSSRFYAGYHPNTGGGAWRQAYDVCAGLLREYAAETVDWARMAEVEGLLEGFLVDTWVNQPGLAGRPGQPPVWAWLEQVLVPHLPVVVRRSARGRYLAWDRWWATAADAGGELDASRGDCDRRSPVAWSSTSVVNEVSALYQEVRTGFSAQRVYTAQDGQLSHVYGGTTDTRVLGHPLAAASQGQYGVRRSPPVELPWCWNTSTALRVLDTLLERQALPPDVATYWVRDGHRLRPGDVRLLTDAERGWSQRVAIVADEPLLTSTGGIVQLRLR